MSNVYTLKNQVGKKMIPLRRLKIKTRSPAWGFYGTIKRKYDLTDSEANDIYDAVGQAIVEKCHISKLRVRCFLDSHQGRHLVDLIEFYGIRNTSTKEFADAAEFLCKDGLWLQYAARLQEIY